MKPLRPFKSGSRWENVTPEFQPFCGSVALGNVTQYNIAMFRKPNGEFFVAVEGCGAYSFGGEVHPGYLGSKLGIQFDGDAANLADLVNAQLGHTSEFGSYSVGLCRERDL